MKSREDLLGEARQQISEMSAGEVYAYLEKGENPALLDVRGLDEWERGHLKGAIHVPRGHLETEVEAKLPDKSVEVVVYCAGGVRSLLAGETLRALGYERVISMEGGYGDWDDAKLPSEQPPPPPEEEAPEDPDMLRVEIEHLEQVLAKKKGRLEEGRKN